MAFRIGRSENVAKALLRLARDDLKAARRDLKATDRREERVHRVRQRLKRVRTVLRIMEPVFAEQAVAVRRSLAEAARLLAHARDADVAATNARSLAAATRDDLGFDHVVETLDQQAANAHRRRMPIRDVDARLASALGDMSKFQADFGGRSCLMAALRRAYAKGRRAMRKAQTTLATPDLHRWRKSAKDLWHILLLARKRLPTKTRSVAKRLDRLGELLGVDNDNALLAEKLALSPSAGHQLMSQLALIAKQRNDLESEAFKLGRRIYRQRPKAFSRRNKVR
jgi:CHAD domain-containing protein